jgi:Ribbon-helix-helix domain
MEEAVRGNIKVSREVDLTLRTYLGAQGMKKGDLSKFIEEAVRWRIFNRTVRDIKSRNADAGTRPHTHSDLCSIQLALRPRLCAESGLMAALETGDPLSVILQNAQRSRPRPNWDGF